VLLVLLLLHVDLSAAQHDYMLTQGELVTEREERLKDIRAIGLPDEFADCIPDFVEKVDEHIRDRYGSIEQYLEGAGVDKQMQRQVKANLAVAEE
jgi:protein-tyrosine phosphatase